jgi:hypothetical protein
MQTYRSPCHECGATSSRLPFAWGMLCGSSAQLGHPLCVLPVAEGAVITEPLRVQIPQDQGHWRVSAWQSGQGHGPKADGTSTKEDAGCPPCMVQEQWWSRTICAQKGRIAILQCMRNMWLPSTEDMHTLCNSTSSQAMPQAQTCPLNAKQHMPTGPYMPTGLQPHLHQGWI